MTLPLEDVPLETAVRLLAEMAGLKPVRVGNTLFVTKKEIAADLRRTTPRSPRRIRREPTCTRRRTDRCS